MYTAVKSDGAFLNGRLIRVTEKKVWKQNMSTCCSRRRFQNLAEALVVNNIGASREQQFIDDSVNRLGSLLENGLRALRNSGTVM
jgi:hypothetical protein